MEANLREALNRLWSEECPTLSPDGSNVGLDLRQRYEIDLPEDFETYICNALPSEDWMDAHGIIWWSATRLRRLSDECGCSKHGNTEIADEADRYLVFADFLDWCYAYAICCSAGPNRGRVALVGNDGKPGRFVAASFASFLKLAAAGSDRLHSPVGDHYTDIV